MKVIFYSLLATLAFGCHKKEVSVNFAIIVKTEAMEPVAGAEVFLNDRKIGESDNFGLFENVQTFELAKSEPNIIRVTKKSPYHTFEDAIIHIIDHAFEDPRKRIVLKAKMRMKPQAKESRVSQPSLSLRSPDQEEKAPKAAAKASQDRRLTPQKTASHVSTKPTPTLKQDKPKVAQSKSQSIYMEARKALQKKQPERALQVIQALTMSDGKRVYHQGLLFGAHVNEALAHYYLGNDLLNRRSLKQAYKHYQRCIEILNDTLSHINDAPESIRTSITMEAKFNRALAVHKMYNDLGMKNYKIKAYESWRSIYNSLSMKPGSSKRHNQIKKYAIESMQKLEKQIL